MIEILAKFEYRAAELPPVLLVAAAFVTIAAGLFVCLGGLGCKKTLFALIGAYFGVAFTIFFSNSNLMLVVALVGASALLSLKLQDSFLTLLVSILAAVYGFSILIRPYVSTSGELIVMIRQLTIGVPLYNWLMLLLLIVVPIAASSSFWRGTSVVLCSLAGTCLMLAGAIMLLVHSGVAAAGYINSKREFYLVLFIAVTVLGAIAQLLLPKLISRVAAAKEAVRARMTRAKKSKTDDGEARSAPKTATWRTA